MTAHPEENQAAERLDGEASQRDTDSVSAFHWGFAVGTVAGAVNAVDQYCGGSATTAQCSSVLADPKSWGEASGFAVGGGILFVLVEAAIHHFKEHG